MRQRVAVEPRPTEPGNAFRAETLTTTGSSLGRSCLNKCVGFATRWFDAITKRRSCKRIEQRRGPGTCR